ncbi:hypothetical protein ASG12_09050 [Williamsia sp. Leaf354]|uniref:FxsA family protein n=1 Tax=Williamsia sp. Leaf354 TaxID=1736349 RepID=UPI0006F9AFFA|nr:FxsA family protein [Williamsia sp. Leaf354]KQR98569.1 hypothetical protein ASG12_09050 [Williamsia sp. Leaf354]
MKLAVFATYLLVEIGAFVGLVYAIGFWWTLLATFAAVIIGFAMLRRQGARVFAELRAAADGSTDSVRPLTDTALLAGSVFLLFLPGIVSTVLGILLLLGPVRALARPLVAAVGARRVVTAMNRYGAAGGRGIVVEGEVVDPTHPASPGSTPGWRSIG